MSQLKETELLLIALLGMATSEGLNELLAHEHRNVHFLKLVVCGLVLPLHLDVSCVKELYVTISAMQSRQLHLQELGQLVVSLWPGNQPWYTRAMHWVTGTELPHTDLTMMRHFLSSTLAQSPGLDAELGMAMYLAVGQAPDAESQSLQLRALQWLESCVGTSLLNIAAKIQLSRRLLSSNSRSSSSVRFALNSVLEAEFAKHGHGDHQVAATLVLACQEELESKEIHLNELRCHLAGLHATGLDFIWAVAAARVILSKAAKMVKSEQEDEEVAESALELMEVSTKPSRRALEVFLAKNLEKDRIALAKLRSRSEDDPLWNFLAFPAISDGLPSASSLGHEICPSDCLISIMANDYVSLKESILRNAPIAPASNAAKVMALFSTSFLGHFNQQNRRNLPSSRQVTFEQSSLQRLATAMLENFPDCEAWRMSQDRTSDWVFMLRPVVHMAALCVDAPNSFWHHIYRSANSLRDTLLPFMPGDEVAAALEAASARENLGVYRCQCGFTYVIGECTQPNQQRHCPECGHSIGAAGMHVLADGNRSLGNARDARWQNQAQGRQGFVDTRDEGDRQTWRSLTVEDMRTGRYFFHGLLSLRSALQQPTLCHLSLGRTKTVSQPWSSPVEESG